MSIVCMVLHVNAKYTMAIKIKTLNTTLLIYCNFEIEKS